VWDIKYAIKKKMQGRSGSAQPEPSDGAPEKAESAEVGIKGDGDEEENIV